MMRGEKKINGKTKDEGISHQIEPIQLDAILIPYLSGRSDHLKQMGYFFDYLNIHQKDPEERFEILTQKSKADFNWLVNAIFKYLQGHKFSVLKITQIREKVLF
jgi:hypothetical protein